MSAPVLVIAPGRQHERRTRHEFPADGIRWACIGCLLATLCFGVIAFGAVSAWAYCAIIFGVSVSALLLCAEWPRDRSFYPSPLLTPVILFAGVVALQLVLGRSEYSYVTQVQAMQYGACALLIWTVTQAIRTDRELRVFAVTLAAFGFCLALFSILQYLSGAQRIYGFHEVAHPQNIFGPYPNRDHYAGLMEMLAPLPLAFMCRRTLPTAARVTFGFGAALMFASIILSGSRAGMVSALAEIIFLGLFLLSGGRGKGYLASLLLFFAAAAALLYWIDASPALVRWSQLNAGEEIASGRIAIARDAWKMWLHRPVLGFGLGTFTTVYPQYRSFYTDLTVNEVHNDYLQILVETGVAGAAAMFWFLISLYRSGATGIRSSAAEMPRLIRIASLAGCTGLLVHSFFDFNLHIPANAAVFFTLAAVVCLPSSEGSARGDDR